MDAARAGVDWSRWSRSVIELAVLPVESDRDAPAVDDSSPLSRTERRTVTLSERTWDQARYIAAVSGRYAQQWVRDRLLDTARRVVNSRGASASTGTAAPAPGVRRPAASPTRTPHPPGPSAPGAPSSRPASATCSA